MEKRILVVLLLWLSVCNAFALDVLQVGVLQNDDQYLQGANLEIFEDTSGKLTIEQVSSPEFSSRFIEHNSRKHFAYIKHTSSVYWVRFKIQKSGAQTGHYIFENLDLHIDQFEFFRPDPLDSTKYKSATAGYILPFSLREYPHKNFVFDISPGVNPQMYYVKIQSRSHNPFIFKIKSTTSFAHYALNEYYLLGMFYGILAIMAVYNLLMYFSLKDRVFLYYVFYVICSCIIALGEDGTGFQHLWPSYPEFNKYISNFAPLLLMLSFALYSRSFLELRKVLPTMDTIVNGVVGVYIVLFILNIFIPGFTLDFPLYIFPFIVIYIASLLCLRKGLRQARYYIVGYSFLLFSILLMVLRITGLFHEDWIIMVYSFNIGLVFEIVILSFALGDRIKIIRRDNERAQSRIIEQLKENEKLKDQINSELEELVHERTKEIEDKNKELEGAYEEIQRMNELLDADNKELKTNVNELTKARVLAKELGFDEFSQIFPDKDSCLKYLEDLKWAKGYTCKKCGNTKWCKGKGDYFRRCTKCRYDESPTAYTIFHKLKFPVTKAFYMLFLVYANKGKITSIELSQILTLRQSTCWNFSRKITDMMKSKKKSGEHEPEGWGSLVLDPENAD
jgi:hypothetical protein